MMKRDELNQERSFDNSKMRHTEPNTILNSGNNSQRDMLIKPAYYGTVDQKFKMGNPYLQSIRINTKRSKSKQGKREPMIRDRSGSRSRKDS